MKGRLVFVLSVLIVAQALPLSVNHNRDRGPLRRAKRHTKDRSVIADKEVRTIISAIVDAILDGDRKKRSEIPEEDDEVEDQEEDFLPDLNGDTESSDSESELSIGPHGPAITGEDDSLRDKQESGSGSADDYEEAINAEKVETHSSITESPIDKQIEDKLKRDYSDVTRYFMQPHSRNTETNIDTDTSESKSAVVDSDNTEAGESQTGNAESESGNNESGSGLTGEKRDNIIHADIENGSTSGSESGADSGSGSGSESGEEEDEETESESLISVTHPLEETMEVVDAGRTKRDEEGQDVQDAIERKRSLEVAQLEEIKPTTLIESVTNSTESSGVASGSGSGSESIDNNESGSGGNDVSKRNTIIGYEVNVVEKRDSIHSDEEDSGNESGSGAESSGSESGDLVDVMKENVINKRSAIVNEETLEDTVPSQETNRSAEESGSGSGSMWDGTSGYGYGDANSEKREKVKKKNTKVERGPVIVKTSGESNINDTNDEDSSAESAEEESADYNSSSDKYGHDKPKSNENPEKAIAKKQKGNGETEEEKNEGSGQSNDNKKEMNPKAKESSRISKDDDDDDDDDDDETETKENSKTKADDNDDNEEEDDSNKGIESSENKGDDDDDKNEEKDDDSKEKESSKNKGDNDDVRENASNKEKESSENNGDDDDDKSEEKDDNSKEKESSKNEGDDDDDKNEEKDNDSKEKESSKNKGDNDDVRENASNKEKESNENNGEDKIKEKESSSNESEEKNSEEETSEEGKESSSNQSTVDLTTGDESVSHSNEQKKRDKKAKSNRKQVISKIVADMAKAAEESIQVDDSDSVVKKSKIYFPEETAKRSLSEHMEEEDKPVVKNVDRVLKTLVSKILKEEPSIKSSVVQLTRRRKENEEKLQNDILQMVSRAPKTKTPDDETKEKVASEVKDFEGLVDSLAQTESLSPMQHDLIAKKLERDLLNHLSVPEEQNNRLIKQETELLKSTELEFVREKIEEARENSQEYALKHAGNMEDIKRFAIASLKPIVESLPLKKEDIEGLAKSISKSAWVKMLTHTKNSKEVAVKVKRSLDELLNLS